MPREEFHRKFLAAQERRLLTVPEMAKMCKHTEVAVERWLAGTTAPHLAEREKVIRAVE